MGKKGRNLLLLIGWLFFSSEGWNQTSHPPEPMMTTTESTLGPCGGGDGGGGPGIPPPVGLCLPINDYFLPLLISGIVLGGGMMWRLEKKEL